MLLHQIQIKRKYPKTRVGRGGKRGTTSGKGQKGQKSRSGRRIRPAERELIQRLPKLRGYSTRGKHKSLKEKLPVINVGDLEKMGQEKFKFFLKEKGRVKILGDGEIKTPFHIVSLPISKSAKEKILAAGGTVK